MVRAAVAYAARRLNSTTFLVVHNDKYTEHPFIYVKLYSCPPLAVLIDTGCGRDAPAQDNTRFADLRQFLEECPVADNDGRPLNGFESGVKGRKREYMVVCTHCHYDHICGIPSFASRDGDGGNTTVIASSYDKEFLSRANLPRNSECNEMGIPTPAYDITFARDREWLEHAGKQLRLRVLHTPGHTPDSLALYDEREHWLFTGDSFYNRRCVLPDGSDFRQAIIFGAHGDWTRFERSVKKLLAFVDGMEITAKVLRQDGVRMRVGCGHTTDAAPAEELLEKVLAYFRRVAVTFEVPVRERRERRGETWALWQESGDPEFSIMAPERLLLEYSG